VLNRYSVFWAFEKALSRLVPWLSHSNIAVIRKP
jgi:hypothetical protein